MSNKPHILVVDDDNRILKLLKKFLSQEGFLVSTSTSTNEAVELLANFNYDRSSNNSYERNLTFASTLLPNV